MAANEEIVGGESGESGQFVKDESKAVLSLLTWCAKEVGKKVAQIDPDVPFFHIREEWGNRFILCEAIATWVQDSYGIEALYPDELDARTTPSVFVSYLTQKCKSGEALKRSHEKNEGIIDESLPGLADESADYSGDELVREPTVFLLGCPRSGTTLFRSMLAGHDEIHAPPELHILQYNSLKSRERDIVRKNRQWMLSGLVQTLEHQMSLERDQAFQYVSQLTRRDLSVAKTYQLIHSISPKKVLLDKSPSMARRISWLSRAEKMFVHPRYLFLTRHPCAVIESITRTVFDFSDTVTDNKTVSGAEDTWKCINRNIADFLSKIPQERWLQVRYEDLVCEPEIVQRKVLDFMELPFDSATLCPYSGARQIDGVGDPNLPKRKQINPELVDSWRSKSIDYSLSEGTMALASKLGYELEESLRES